MFITTLQKLFNFCFKNDSKTENEPESNVKKKNNSKNLYQIFISLGPLILTSGVGAMMGFSGIFLPQLKENEGQIKNVDSEVESWIAASAVLPMTISSLLGGYLMEKIGRKWGHIITAIPGILGWIIIAFSTNISTILLGRILTGIYCGVVAPITSAYIGEVTSPSLRPFVLGCIALNLNLGTLFCHLIGTFLTWEKTAIFCLLLPTIGGFFTFFSQESPSWLIRNKRIDEADIVFKKIRGENNENTIEFNTMLQNRETQHASLWNTIKVSVSTPEIYKPTLTLVLYFVSAQFSGINVVTFYAISIVERSLGSKFEKTYFVMILMDSVRTVTSIFACVLLRKLRRRQITIIGGLGTFFCLITLSISNFFSEYLSKSEFFAYVPLVALLGYVFFISISFVPLPWCLAGELLPQKVKGLASGILCLTAFSAFFTAVKCSPFLFNNFGTHSTYFIFSMSALFGTALCYFFLPETKDKTLDDIAKIYRKNDENGESC